MQSLTQYLNQIITGDSREILKQFPSGSIDCVCSDVPYLVATGGVAGVKKGIHTGGILNRQDLESSKDLKKKWLRKDASKDNVEFISSGKFFKNVPKFEEWLPEVYRVLKDGSHCYLMINARNIKELQTKAEEAGFKYLNLLVWEKQNRTPNKYYQQGCEFILMLRKGYAKNIKDMGKANIFKFANPIGNKFHPNEKPVQLMKEMIEQSTNPNDIVLDMFCGSGASCIASKELGLNYIGIEIEKQYADIAKDRLANPFIMREKPMSEQTSLFQKGGQ